jgi:hypothetical protein
MKVVNGGKAERMADKLRSADAPWKNLEDIGYGLGGKGL